MSRFIDKTVGRRGVYLDYAAATPLDPRVRKEMNKATELFGNPSSFNDSGMVARRRMEESRNIIARFINARSDEIVFTSSGSEANNLAVFGVSDLLLKPGEIITTPIEHSSVLKSLQILGKRSWKITYLKIDGDGLVDLRDLEKNKFRSCACFHNLCQQ